MDKKQLQKLKKLLLNLLAKNPSEFMLVTEADGWLRITDIHKALMEIGVTHLTPKALLQYFLLYGFNEFETDEKNKLVRARLPREGIFLYRPKNPPPFLFVPIRPKAFWATEKQGIGPQGKKWLPLFASRSKALIFGKRFHHSPLIIKVLAEMAHQAEIIFYYAGSQLYLIDSWIDPAFLRMPQAPIRKRDDTTDKRDKSGARSKKHSLEAEEKNKEGSVLSGTFMPSIEVVEDFYREKERRARKRAQKTRKKRKKRR